MAFENIKDLTNVGRKASTWENDDPLLSETSMSEMSNNPIQDIKETF
jgi:hypothetical protein